MKMRRPGACEEQDVKELNERERETKRDAGGKKWLKGSWKMAEVDKVVRV